MTTDQNPADQTALRDRIAEALMQWAEGNNSPQYASMRRPETVRANAYSRADAVLAVLPPPADRAAEIEQLRECHAASLRRADELNNALMQEVQRYAAGTEQPVLWSVYNEMHKRALNAEAEVKRLAADRAAVLTGREKAMLAFALEMAEEEIHARSLDFTDDDKAALASLRRMADETQPADRGVTVHAIPLPGSNGISACCERPPCKFVGERVTRDPDKVTCTGLTAAARQDGAQP